MHTNRDIGVMTVAAGKEYLKLAIAQAISLKMVSAMPIAIVTDQIIPDEYKMLFDYSYQEFISGMVGSSFVMKYTPFQWTLKTDADVIFTNDIYSILKWSTTLTKINAPSFVFDYKGRQILDTQYRRRFVKNDIPSVYSGMFFFKSDSDISDIEWSMNHMENHWEEIYAEKYYHEKFPFNTDEALGLIFNKFNVTPSLPISFTHMKPELCGFPQLTEWPKNLPLTYHKHSWFIGPVRQIWPIHVVPKKMMIDLIEPMRYDFERIC